MAVASPRLFLALRLFLPPSVSVSLPAFLPPLPPPPVLAHRPHRTLRPSSCTESVPHTTFAYVYCRHTYPPIHIRVHAYGAHTHARSASLDVFARSVYHPPILPPPPPPFHRSVPSSLLFVPLTGYHVRVSRSENSSVGPE